MFRKLVSPSLVALALSAFGCGADDGSHAPPSLWENVAEIEHGAVARTFARDFRYFPKRLRVAPDGTAWSLQLSTQRYGSFWWGASLLGIDASGHVREIALDARNAPRDFAIHPSGTVSVLFAGEGGRSYVQRLSSDGRELGRWELPAETSAPAYELDEAGSLVQREAGAPSFVAAHIAADGEAAEVVGHNGGMELVRIGESGAVERRTQLSPAFASLDVGWYFEGELLVADGTIYWATVASPRDREAYTKLSGRSVETGVDDDVLVMALDRTGKTLWSKALLAVGDDYPNGIASNDTELAIAGSAQPHADPTPNSSSTSDVLLLRVQRENGELLRRDQIHLSDNGYASDVAPCEGGFCVAGSTGPAFAEPASAGAFDSGVVLAVRSDGSWSELVRVGSAGDTRVASLAPAPNGDLFFVGTIDGTVTATDDKPPTMPPNRLLVGKVTGARR